MTTDLGIRYTKGGSFRARAEARQRGYRATVLEVGWAQYGHLLDPEAEAAGANFVVPQAFEAAKARKDAGKGVHSGTFRNMLSSQAMCFNVFAPLAADPELATTLIGPFLPGLVEVTRLEVEHVPDGEVFGDQAGRAGVGCDVLIEGRHEDGGAIVVALETKLVEETFSVCGFRRQGRGRKGKAVCTGQVPVRDEPGECLYVSEKGYLYWDRTREVGLLRDDALPPVGCPFSGPLWQLWVNHLLAHVEAARRGAGHALFAICAPAANARLLRDGQILADYSRLAARPETVAFVDLDALIRQVTDLATARTDWMDVWAKGLADRYGAI